MKITDEAVEAAKRIRDTAMQQTLAARIPESGHFGAIAQDADWLVDHLTAALPHMGGVRVKPLEWEPVHGEGVETYQATCSTGIYRVFEDEDSAAGAVFAEFAIDVSRFCMTDALSIGRFHNFDVAQAAAQADYERRVLSALASHEPAPEVCATEGCENPATHWRGKWGVGAFYCETCDGKIAAGVAAAEKRIAAIPAGTLIDSLPDEVLFGDHSDENPTVRQSTPEPAKDGPEVVERLRRWCSETINQWSDEYEPRENWERQVSGAMREWDKATTEIISDYEALRAENERLRIELDMWRASSVSNYRHDQIVARNAELVKALDQLLDDMGENGLCVCQAAKDQAIAVLGGQSNE